MLYMVKAKGKFRDGSPAWLFYTEVKLIERATPKGAVRWMRKHYEHIFGKLEVYVYQYRHGWIWDVCHTTTGKPYDYADYCWTYGPDMEAIQSSPNPGVVA